MNPNAMDVTPGSGAKVATSLVNEGGVDKHFQRMVPSTGEGEDVSVGSFKQIDVTVTRPANTTPYTANDAWADATPTVGGFVFANASRAAGKSGLITDLTVFGSAAQGTQLQGELWLFDSAITAVADNAGFSLTITDLRKLVAKIGFTLEAAGGGVSIAEALNLNRGFTTVGSANLNGLIKVKNAYTPVSAEALTFRLKVMRAD